MAEGAANLFPALTTAIAQLQLGRAKGPFTPNPAQILTVEEMRRREGIDDSPLVPAAGAGKR